MNNALNRRALTAAERLLATADEFRVAVHPIEGGGRYVDCGIEARGGWLAGIELRRSAWAAWRTSRLCPAKFAGQLCR